MIRPEGLRALLCARRQVTGLNDTDACSADGHEAALS
jgi:hypothetical protein